MRKALENSPIYRIIILYIDLHRCALSCRERGLYAQRIIIIYYTYKCVRLVFENYKSHSTRPRNGVRRVFILYYRMCGVI